MTRSLADALCLECNKPFKWLIGNPRVCPFCLTEEKQGEDTDDENED